MGNNNSNLITINVNHDSLFYFTDEIIQGSVNVNLTEDKLEFNEIYVKLIGEVGYTTRESRRDSNGNSKSETKYHHIEFYSTTLSLVIPEFGQKQLVLNSGKHSWSFQFQLPSYLPPSINQPDSYPCVRYYLEVIIDKPWYKINIRQRKYLTIYPYVNLLEYPQCLTTIQFEKQNRKQIKLQGTLNKSGYVPNELVYINYTIENSKKVLIKYINISLIQSVQLVRNKDEIKIFETTLPNIFNIKDQLITETFNFMIPSGFILPSYQFKKELNKEIDTINISYIIKFEVKVEGMFTNFHIDIPIIIGTELKYISPINI